MSKVIQTITESEEQILIRHLLDKTMYPNRYSKRLRNTVIFLLMLDAGLRVGEVVNLQVPDLVTLNEPVHTLVLGANLAKKRANRSVPLTQRLRTTIKELNKHIWQYEPRPDAHWCFFGYDPSEHITTRQVERFIKKLSTSAIDREIHPHVLRHTFATNLMRTSSIRIVQELLGHKSLTSTQVYTHPTNNDLVEAIGTLETGHLPRN